MFSTTAPRPRTQTSRIVSLALSSAVLATSTVFGVASTASATPTVVMTWNDLQNIVLAGGTNSVALGADMVSGLDYLYLEPGDDLTIDLNGHSLTVDPGSGYGAGVSGIRVPSSAILTILATGGGSLSAYGTDAAGSNGAGAGIGGFGADDGGSGTRGQNCGTVKIQGGTIYAEGGDGGAAGWPSAAGIGGGGGALTSAGRDSLGGGSGCTLELSGGTIEAVGGFSDVNGGAAMGAGGGAGASWNTGAGAAGTGTIFGNGTIILGGLGWWTSGYIQPYRTVFTATSVSGVDFTMTANDGTVSLPAMITITFTTSGGGGGSNSGGSSSSGSSTLANTGNNADSASQLGWVALALGVMGVAMGGIAARRTSRR